MLCPNNDCANFVVCDEIFSSLVICWKTRYDRTKISEWHFLADETARRTESLPKLIKVHRILFGIPDFNFVRNIPRHDVLFKCDNLLRFLTELFRTGHQNCCGLVQSSLKYLYQIENFCCQNLCASDFLLMQCRIFLLIIPSNLSD